MIRIRNDRYLSGIRIIIRNIGYRILECDSIRQSDTIALIQFQDRLGITKDVIATIKGTRIFNVVFGLCLRDIDLSKITESVIKQRNRIFIIIRILIPSIMSSGCLSEGRMCSMWVMVILHNASLAKNALPIIARS